jgi:hypothetical protein
MLSPSLSDWPIQPRILSTTAQPPGGFRPTRHELALAFYLERQDAHRAAIIASRQAAQIRPHPFLRLTDLGRFLKRKVLAAQ